MAEMVDHTSFGTTKWTFRTFHMNLGFYVEWGAETIREKPGGWGWQRAGTPRPFTLQMINGAGDIADAATLNPLVTVERGFNKIWVVFGWMGSPGPGDGVYPQPIQPFDPRLITDVVMNFRHRGHGYRLSHVDGLSIVP
ncbi:hypothetical protein AB0M02_44655 [Actinoplanes sp. NPDC051861]|uniref:hypothetical protein n=1 Tax=Actinoplanes sp. NPDC051861 TaxID=3155170 RepID=UPI0034240649